MTQLFRFFLSFALAFFSLIAFSQNSSDNPDLIYGNDPQLYNGRIYTFFPIAGTGGTQYINEKFDIGGAVKLRGVSYSGLTLNYDVYNQLLVLQYKNSMGSKGLIEISGAWLESFDLDGRHFEIETGTETDTTKRIYQVLGNGTLKIMYYMRKELLNDTRVASRNHFFTEIIRELYVKKDNSLIKYKNNRSFIAIFSKPNQDSIKKYLRRQKVKVRKANDFAMTDLINYCNTLNGF